LPSMDKAKERGAGERGGAARRAADEREAELRRAAREGEARLRERVAALDEDNQGLRRCAPALPYLHASERLVVCNIHFSLHTTLPSQGSALLFIMANHKVCHNRTEKHKYPFI